uniref:Uncharacterized protein n=1 Tax=Rhizophora mucronata TaxID=61149 RepID=A0A2P2QF42_RHIMU
MNCWGMLDWYLRTLASKTRGFCSSLRSSFGW